MQSHKDLLRACILLFLSNAGGIRGTDCVLIPNEERIQNFLLTTLSFSPGMKYGMGPVFLSYPHPPTSSSRLLWPPNPKPFLLPSLLIRPVLHKAKLSVASTKF
eukprot:765307-Hanusia_phi.AAC.1